MISLNQQELRKQKLPEGKQQETVYVVLGPLIGKGLFRIRIAFDPLS
jgi:hypothetical protein